MSENKPDDVLIKCDYCHEAKLSVAYHCQPPFSCWACFTCSEKFIRVRK